MQESAPQLNMVEVPLKIKGKRELRSIPVTPIHECLEAEAASDCFLGNMSELSDWSMCFKKHKTQTIDGDNRQVWPVAIYTDGIKFNRAIGPGRQESLIAITAYNLATYKRHLIAIVSKEESLGWDTLFPIWENVAWSMRAATIGQRPRTRWDGSDWPESSPYGTMRARMRHRYILCQLKMDWMEIASSMGFPTWSSANNPCPLCNTKKSGMFDWRDLSLEDSAWGSKPTTYDAECRRCEIYVTVSSERDRELIMIGGGLRYSNDKRKMSYSLTSSVPEFSLLAGDRLEPCETLQCSEYFATKPVPFECRFWRLRLDTRGRSLAWVNRRCPVFDMERLGTSPDNSLHLDTLHSLYQGIFLLMCFV
jgi:hypothetical protein